MSNAKNEKQLSALHRLLLKQAFTATEVARRTRCSRPAAYRRLQKLIDCNVVEAVGSVREGRSGPASLVYHAK